MKPYKPRRGSIVWNVLSVLDEDGAQWTVDLCERFKVTRQHLVHLLSYPVEHELVGHERRKRLGRSENIWFLTPAGADLVARLIHPQMEEQAA